MAKLYQTKFFLKFIKRASIEIRQSPIFFYYFRQLFKMFLLHQLKNIIVVYCLGKQFLEFTVREMKA